MEPGPSASRVPRLTGRVLHASGAPAEGAEVRVASSIATTDAAGAFDIGLGFALPDDDLVATLVGSEPAVVPRVREHEDVRAGRPLDVVLPGPALAIDGVLCRPDGTPCAGWKLELHRGTALRDQGFPPLTAEDLAAGARMQPNDRFGHSLSETTNPNRQTTGDDGVFHIGGLRSGHDYVLRAWNTATLQTVISEPVRAGRIGFVFVVPAADLRARVDGRAVDRHGMPVAGVRVRLTMREHQAGGSTSFQTGQTTETAADGSFAFHEVPREDLLLRFDGRGVESLYHELRAGDPGVALEVRLACSCRFRFERLPGSAEIDSIRVLNAAGQELRMSWSTGEGRTQGSLRHQLREGATPELTVTDAATWLVLEVEGRELRRLPMRLLRDDVLVLRG